MIVDCLTSIIRNVGNHSNNDAASLESLFREVSRSSRKARPDIKTQTVNERGWWMLAVEIVGCLVLLRGHQRRWRLSSNPVGPVYLRYVTDTYVAWTTVVEKLCRCVIMSFMSTLVSYSSSHCLAPSQTIRKINISFVIPGAPG